MGPPLGDPGPRLGGRVGEPRVEGANAHRRAVRPAAPGNSRRVTVLMRSRTFRHVTCSFGRRWAAAPSLIFVVFCELLEAPRNPLIAMDLR